MIKSWQRMTILQRLSLAILHVTMLGYVGSFIWGYSTWPMSALFIVAVVLNGIHRNLNGVRRNPGARNAHPQENDPNRR
jgi:hypothetical protein